MTTLDDLVRDHRPALMAHALTLTARDRAWAEDVVQETFIRAWRHLDRMTEAYGSVRGWLMRVAHNVAVDGHRATRTDTAGAETVEGVLPPVDDPSDAVLSALQVRGALATLPQGHRDVLEEVYLRDRTLADTARELRLPVGTVKSRVFYGLRQLRCSTTARACLESEPARR